MTPVIQLRTLGGVDLVGPTREELQAVVAQPKRLALLVYLARANSSGFRRRDTVLALFWPELDDAHARGALRQALRFLRRSLGNGVIVTRGEEEVGVERAALWCDATAFTAACDAGKSAEAMALYHGEFLEGLHVADASRELELWLDEERAGLRRHAVAAAWAEAERLRNAGELPAAKEFARRAAALAPDDEAVQARLIALLDHAGDRAGALDVSEQLARRLREDYEVEPAPETRVLVERIRKRTAPHAVPKEQPALAPPAEPTAASGFERAQPVPRRLPVRLAAAVSVAVLAIAAWIAAARPWHTSPLDQNLVAVVPFRTVGLDSTYGEGMVDLLAATLAGDGGPRAASPQAVMRNWSPASPSKEGARKLGRSLGAGRVVLGSMVGTQAGIVLQAELLGVAEGNVIAQARAAGPPDSIVAIVDRLAAQLLAAWSGETGRRLAALAGSSPEALRPYLLGVAAYRRGYYPAAQAHFNHALDLDSTLVLAALGLANADLWAGGSDRGVKLAWAARDRLSPDERALVLALGADVILPQRTSGRAVLALRERAVEAAPDRAEAWFLFGDQLHHDGSLLLVPAWRDRSLAAFWRALEFDSMLAGPLLHLLESASAVGDTAIVRRVAARVLANQSPLTDYYRWLIAGTLGDTAGLAELRARFEAMDWFNLTSILHTLSGAEAAADFDRVVAIVRRRASSTRELEHLLFRRLRVLLLNGGRQQAWRAEIEQAAVIPGLTPAVPHTVILDALYWNGDTSLAERAARQLARGAADGWVRDALSRDMADTRACALAQWNLRVGRLAAARELARWLARAGRGPATVCAAMVDADLATREEDSHAAVMTDRLDSLLREDPYHAYGGLVLARLRETQGDIPGALAAITRVPANQPPLYLSTYLLEEGRLATVAGDHARAAGAYEQYLALRFNPEPEIAAEVQWVRGEFARLRKQAASH